MRRSPPEDAVTVVGHVGHLVAAEAVLLGDGVERAPHGVGDQQTVVSFYLYQQSAVELFCLGDVLQHHLAVSPEQGFYGDDFRLHAHMEVCGSLLPEGHPVVGAYLVDAVVTGHEHQLALGLEDLHHLALELSSTAHLPDGQAAIGCRLQSAQEVVAAHPYPVVAGPIDHGDAVDGRCIEHPPLRTVIIEQSGEVGHVDGAVAAYLYIEVAVVASILLCRIVAYQRQALGAKELRIEN